MKRTDTDKGNPHAISSNYIARWVDRNVEQSSVIMVDRKIVTDCRIQSYGKIWKDKKIMYFKMPP